MDLEPTFLSELDVGLSPSVAVLDITRVVPEVVLLQSVDGQRDGHLLLPKVLSDCPAQKKKKFND